MAANKTPTDTELRRELFGDSDEESRDDRQKLLSQSERIAAGSRRIQNARRLAAETESVGLEIIGELSSQRDKITKAKDGLRATNSAISQSQRVLRSMIQRARTNRWMMYAIILILLILIGVIIYYKWFK
eukprot:c410_g1_i1.p1 GENE.c410_g1_i1~~c410_g1_i1.p1  ORF type:complete len:130 (-),score=23.16 c410_g1_i1:14-403(-)